MASETRLLPAISLAVERLKSLPPRSDVWQLGMARMPSWVAEEGKRPYRPLIALCRGATGGPVGNGDACAPGDGVGPTAIAAVARLAVTRGMGCRPEAIEVRDPQLAEALRADLASCGIEVTVVERLDALDEVIADMTRRIGGKAATTRFFGPGIEVDCLRAFAEAALEFYRAAPWNHLTDDDLVCVESPAAPTGLGCFTVLGAGGVERGIGFFASRERFERFKRSNVYDPRVGAAGLWLMSFDEIMDWPLADSELWEMHHLPAVGDRGYPSLVCHLPSGGMKPSSPEQLEFVEGLLRALATTTEDELDSGRWSKSVRTIEGRRTIELSLTAVVEARSGARRRPSPDSSEMPDRRAMEQTLRDFQKLLASREFESADEVNAFLASRGGKLPKHSPSRTPHGKAQELIDRAVEERGRMRIKLAREALRLWPDCAEGWVLQAEQMPDLERRRDLYQKAVEAAERALGPRPFTEDVGHFWGMLETRPYMRARNGLAGALWEAGRRDEAIAHWQELLRLNPNDNQGVRDVLAPRLLEARRDSEAEAVLAQFDEDASAMLEYARVLLEYRRTGAGPAAQATLDMAIRDNPQVPKYLTGRASMKGPLPDSYRAGSDDEARIAAAVLSLAWNATEGAIEWLGRSIRPPKSERRALRAEGRGKRRK